MMHPQKPRAIVFSGDIAALASTLGMRLEKNRFGAHI